jgi:NAD(P)-dependent dehydrogenase (short-subunit alcohol dehydrogenase family)
MAQLRRVLVSGAGGGLGLATLLLLRENGWHAAGLDLFVPEGLEGPFFACDVTDPAQVEIVVSRLVENWGGLDGLAHCAGIFRNTLTPIHLLSDEDWDATISVNLTGSFVLARAALPHLVRSGSGSIVLVSSIGADSPQPGGGAYAASKAGVAALASAIALEYGIHGVRCNAVLPGYMDTRMAAPVLGRPHLREALEKEIPIPRVADPVEVSRAIAYLLSEAASYVTGHQLRVDGGVSLMSLTTRRDLDRLWRNVEATNAARASTQG